MQKIKVDLIALFGLPGAGKGTVMAILEKLAAASPDISVKKVEMGAYFRAKAKTEAAIKDKMDDGKLLSNSMVNDVFEQLVNAALAEMLLKGEPLKEKVIVLLDGYPRTSPQWDYFREYLWKLKQQSMGSDGVPAVSDAAIFIELDEKIVLHRSTIRRLCPVCGGTFSAEEHQICPHCGKSEGKPRPDDQRMIERVRVFNESTLPVISEAKTVFDHQITVSGEDTKLASEQVWSFLQTL